MSFEETRPARRLYAMISVPHRRGAYHAPALSDLGLCRQGGNAPPILSFRCAEKKERAARRCKKEKIAGLVAGDSLRSEPPPPPSESWTVWYASVFAAAMACKSRIVLLPYRRLATSRFCLWPFLNGPQYAPLRLALPGTSPCRGGMDRAAGA